MRLRGESLIWGFITAALVSPAAATVKDGVDAWQAGNYAKAIAEWRQPAEQGDADAQFNLGQAYKLGRGVPADSKIAQSWYLKAAGQGHEQAQANLGLIMFQGGDRKNAMPWIIKAAQQGEPRAQYVLGTAMFNGDLVARDWPRAYALMTRAAASGLPQAASSLQQMDGYISIADRQAGAALAREMENGGSFAVAMAPSVASTLPAKNPAAKNPAAKPPVPKTPAPKTAMVKPAPVATTTLQPSTPAVQASAPPRAVQATPKPATPVPTPGAPAVVPSSGGWKVQIGAYGSRAAAEKAWGDVSKSGAVQGGAPDYIPVGTLTRLRIGPFAGKAEANTACQALQKAGFNCFPVAP